MKVEDTKYGLMVLDTKNPKEDGSFPIVHFVGYLNEPTEEDIEKLLNELKTNESFGFKDHIEDYIIYPATEEVINYIIKVYTGDDAIFHS